MSMAGNYMSSEEQETHDRNRRVPLSQRYEASTPKTAFQIRDKAKQPRIVSEFGDPTKEPTE